MTTYAAFIFATKDEIQYAGIETMRVIQALAAGTKFKRAEDGQGLLAVLFITEQSPQDVAQAFAPLQHDQARVWVLPADNPIRMSPGGMEFLRRNQPR